MKRDLMALWLAAQDPRVPWYAKALAVTVVAYAVSPIDLIPDFIPVVGLLDDLILLPIGIWLVIRAIPPSLMAELRARASESESAGIAAGGAGRVACAVIVALWLAAAALGVTWLAGWWPAS